MNWNQYRKWKHLLFWPMAVIAWLFLHDRELSPMWYAGLALALSLGIAYLVEEIVWMSKPQGRPCGHCGKSVELKSFKLHLNCPHCGVGLE